MTHTNPTQRSFAPAARALTLCLLATAAALLLPGRASAQWTTNGNTTSTTNNVGVGTTAPTTKLDVVGVTKSDAFNVGGTSAEKSFTILWGNDVANQKVQVYWPASTQVDGIFEITVTGHYWFSNSNGGIRRRVVINGRNIGVINMQQSEVPFRMGFTGSANTISDIKWDAANSRYYFIVANLDNKQNAITIHVKSITPGATPANADNLNITPIYTTDTTAYPQLQTSFNGSNVGIGTLTPASLLFVGGGTAAVQALPGINVALGGNSYVSASNGIINTFLGSDTSTYGIVGTLSNHPLGLRANNVLAMTLMPGGNVGVGTAAPAHKLDVAGSVNAAGLCLGGDCKTAWSQISGTSQWTTSGTSVSYNAGHVGIGTSAPANQLHVNNAAGFGSMRVSGNGAIMSFKDAAAPVNSKLYQWRSEGGVFRMSLVDDSETAMVQYNILTANSAGNVGVGTPSPRTVLQANGSGIPGFTGTAGSVLSVSGGGIDHHWGIDFRNSDGVTYPHPLARIATQFTSSGTNMLFGTSNSYASGVTNSALAIRYDGNVGIGTTAPSGARLHLYSPSDTYLRIGAPLASQSAIAFNNDANGQDIVLYRPGGTRDFAIWTATSSTAMTVKQSGSIGVGTTAPGFKFDVQGGAVNASGGLCIAGDCKTAWSQVGGGTSSQWTTSGANIFFSTGNVGVGTSSPAAKLHVTGGARLEGTGRVYLGTGATQNARGLELIEENATTFSIRHHDPSVAWQNIAINPHGGNVGVGTVSPRGKLEVAGGALFLGDMGNASWGNVVVRGRVFSANSNVHISPPGGTGVYIDSNYREAGGATGPVNLHVSGDVVVGGNIAAKYQDVAEWVPSTQKLAPGTVVILDADKTNHVVASGTPYDTKVAGVISAQPGIALGERGEGKLLVATTGRVRVRVDAGAAPIKVGDLLVTSGGFGVAMKSVPVDIAGMPFHRPGTIIGKALEPLEKGTGEILVLLSLQ